MALTGCNKVTDELKTEVEGEINERIIPICKVSRLWGIFISRRR